MNSLHDYRVRIHESQRFQYRLARGLPWLLAIMLPSLIVYLMMGR